MPGVTIPAAEDGSLDFEIFNGNGGGGGLLQEEPATDIRWALIVDRMYKGKLKDGDLDAFTPEIPSVQKIPDSCSDGPCFPCYFPVLDTIAT